MIFENIFDKILDTCRKPLVNFLLAIAASALFFVLEFSVVRVFSEEEVLRSVLTFRPHVFVRDFLIFFFLTSVAFVITNRHLGERLAEFPPFLRFSIFLFSSNLAFVVLLFSYTRFLTLRLAFLHEFTWPLLAAWYAVGFLTVMTALLTFIDVRTVAKLFWTFKKEWAISASFSLLFLYLTPFLEQYWQPLSRAVGATTAFFLKFTFSGAFFDPNTFYLGVREFSVYVYKPCSGVEGIRLFLFLFTLVLIFDWKKVAKFRALLVAAVGTAVMFLADVFRIYAIMFLGYVIYKKMGHEAAYRIVLEQFHSHFGWFFYILVLLILFRLSYPFLIRFSSQEKPEAKAIGPS